MKVSSNIESQSIGLLEKVNKEEVSNSKSTSFQNILTQNEDKENIKLEKTLDDLLADIISLMKTGMTVDEYNKLQELLRELKEKIEEGNYSEDEIEKILSNIEKEIQALKKGILGQAIEKAEDPNLKKANTTEESSFLDRIEKAMETLEDLNTGKVKKEGLRVSSNESELLQMIKDFQK
ncbi:hypothetical protein [Arcobacter sp. LA11]|uniref:hypothetical protein n=1 Tax=Arcobacter sp. LA11 TaxID=1898176 RepID=UPI0009352FB3|nr:hypothetical protein [Arcobacter sp. LA11]